MKLERIALQVVRSADEAAAVLLRDNPEFFSRLAEDDLAQIANYVAKSVHHGKPIVRISLKDKKKSVIVRPVWPNMPYPIPSDLIRCVLIRPVGIALKHISLRQPLLWHYDMRLDLDLLKNKTQSEVWRLVRQLTIGRPIAGRGATGQ
jgi:hypothetical protein